MTKRSTLRSVLIGLVIFFMNNFTQKENDNKIREALKIADKKNQLDVVAAVVGIAGGAKRLKEIMNSTEDLHIMDRGMLSIHLVI